MFKKLCGCGCNINHKEKQGKDDKGNIVNYDYEVITPRPQGRQVYLSGPLADVPEGEYGDYGDYGEGDEGGEGGEGEAGEGEAGEGEAGEGEAGEGEAGEGEAGEGEEGEEGIYGDGIYGDPGEGDTGSIGGGEGESIGGGEGTGEGTIEGTEGEESPLGGEDGASMYGEGGLPPEGEDGASTDMYGEGEPPPEGEASASMDGEGEPPPEGEDGASMYGEGDLPPEGEDGASMYGEGDLPPEGEDGASMYGEGELPPEGEDEVEGEGEEGTLPYEGGYGVEAPDEGDEGWIRVNSADAVPLEDAMPKAGTPSPKVTPKASTKGASKAFTKPTRSPSLVASTTMIESLPGAPKHKTSVTPRAKSPHEARTKDVYTPLNRPDKTSKRTSWDKIDAPSDNLERNSVVCADENFKMTDLKLPPLSQPCCPWTRDLVLRRRQINNIGLNLWEPSIKTAEQRRRTVIFAKHRPEDSQSGFLPGDRLIEVNGTNVESAKWDKILKLIANSDDSVTLKVATFPEITEESIRSRLESYEEAMEGQRPHKDALKEIKKMEFNCKAAKEAAETLAWHYAKKVWIVHGAGFTRAYAINYIGGHQNHGKSMVRLEHSSQEIEVDKMYLEPGNSRLFDRAEDVTNLPNINESCVLHTLRQRYGSNLNHTYGGYTNFIINPMRDVPIYTPRAMYMFHQCGFDEMPPHVYAYAQIAYRQMLSTNRDQSLVMMGRSGSGKTVNAHHLLAYLTVTSGTINHVFTPEKLKAALVLMDAFGGSRTVMNMTASKCTQITALGFDTTGVISSANMQILMLDESRIGRRPQIEFSYHIFYYMLAGANPTQRDKLQLGYQDDPNSFIEHEMRPEELAQATDMWAEIQRAMQTLSISASEQYGIYACLAVIYNLGAAGVVEEAGGQYDFKARKAALRAALVLGISVNELALAIFHPNDYQRNGRGTRIAQGQDALDGFACGLYSEAFYTLMSLINRSIGSNLRPTHTIVIVDTPGFQNPASCGFRNGASFDDLCQNYLQERIQLLFHHTVFKHQKELYKQENIHCDWEMEMQCPKPMVKLIDRSPNDKEEDLDEPSNPYGLLWILESERNVPKATPESFVEHVFSHQGDKVNPIRGLLKRCDNPSWFKLCHLQGTNPVIYNAANWLEFAASPHFKKCVKALLRNAGNLSVNRLYSSVPGTPSVVNTYSIRHSINRQVIFMMDKIQKTHITFIQCLLPKSNAGLCSLDSALLPKPGVSHDDIVINVPLLRSQLRGGQIIDGLRVYSQGFPESMKYKDFWNRYKLFAPPNSNSEDYINGVQSAYKNFTTTINMNKDSYRMGRTMIFFRAGGLASLDDARRKTIGGSDLDKRGRQSDPIDMSKIEPFKTDLTERKRPTETHRYVPEFGGNMEPKRGWPREVRELCHFCHLPPENHPHAASPAPDMCQICTLPRELHAGRLRRDLCRVCTLPRMLHNIPATPKKRSVGPGRFFQMVVDKHPKEENIEYSKSQQLLWGHGEDGLSVYSANSSLTLSTWNCAPNLETPLREFEDAFSSMQKSSYLFDSISPSQMESHMSTPAEWFTTDPAPRSVPLSLCQSNFEPSRMTFDGIPCSPCAATPGSTRLTNSSIPSTCRCKFDQSDTAPRSFASSPYNFAAAEHEAHMIQLGVCQCEPDTLRRPVVVTYPRNVASADFPQPISPFSYCQVQQSKAKRSPLTEAVAKAPPRDEVKHKSSKPGTPKHKHKQEKASQRMSPQPTPQLPLKLICESDSGDELSMRSPDDTLQFPIEMKIGEFKSSFKVLISPDPGKVKAMKQRVVVEKVTTLLNIDKTGFRIGTSHVFFTPVTLNKIVDARDKKVKKQTLAVKCIQQNTRNYFMMRDSPWWQLLNSIQAKEEVKPASLAEVMQVPLEAVTNLWNWGLTRLNWRPQSNVTSETGSEVKSDEQTGDKSGEKAGDKSEGTPEGKPEGKSDEKSKDKSEDKSEDKAKEKPKDKPKDKSKDKSEMTTEVRLETKCGEKKGANTKVKPEVQTHEHSHSAHEQPHKHVPDHSQLTHVQPHDHSHEHFNGHSHEHFNGHSHEHFNDQSHEHFNDHAHECFNDHSHDHSHKHFNDHSHEHFNDHSHEHFNDQSHEHFNGNSHENFNDHSHKHFNNHEHFNDHSHEQFNDHSHEHSNDHSHGYSQSSHMQHTEPHVRQHSHHHSQPQVEPHVHSYVQQKTASTNEFIEHIKIKEFMDKFKVLVFPESSSEKRLMEQIVKVLGLDRNSYTLRKHNIYFPTGGIAVFEKARVVKLQKQEKAVKCIQTNIRALKGIQAGPWWDLIRAMKPRLQHKRKKQHITINDSSYDEFDRSLTQSSKSFKSKRPPYMPRKKNKTPGTRKDEMMPKHNPRRSAKVRAH